MQKLFEDINEYCAAGLCEEPTAPLFVRFSRGIRRYFERRQMPAYNGEQLYPCGSFSSGLCVDYNYSYTVNFSWSRLKQKDENAAKWLREEFPASRSFLPSEHTVGGALYTHSFANFRRIVREGLDSYEERVEKMKENFRDRPEVIYRGVTALLAGNVNYLFDF